MNKNSKILVIGGTGFIGKELVKEFKRRGYKNLTVFSDKIDRKIKGVKYIKGDIRNFEKVKEVIKGKEIIYHLAAVLDEKAPKKVLYGVNVTGTENVVKACLEEDIEKFVYSSTVGVMGTVNEKANESSPLNPETKYEKSKAEAEKIVNNYVREKNLPAIVLRLAMVYGPNKYWKKIIEKAKERFPIIGSGENNWHLLYIENAIEGLIKAGEKGVIGETYIIADKEIKTYKEIYQMICELLSVKTPDKKIPIWLANLIASFYEIKAKLSGFKSIVTREHIKRLTRERKYSISKAQKELNYKPPYSLKDGMKKTVKEIGDSN